jgi:hypothetical protein
MFVMTEKKGGFLWPRRKLQSAGILGATAPPKKTANTVATIAKVSESSHLSPVTALTGRVLSKNLKHSLGDPFEICPHNSVAGWRGPVVWMRAITGHSLGGKRKLLLLRPGQSGASRD